MPFDPIRNYLRQRYKDESDLDDLDGGSDVVDEPLNTADSDTLPIGDDSRTPEQRQALGEFEARKLQNQQDLERRQAMPPLDNVVSYKDIKHGGKYKHGISPDIEAEEQGEENAKYKRGISPDIEAEEAGDERAGGYDKTQKKLDPVKQRYLQSDFAKKARIDADASKVTADAKAQKALNTLDDVRQSYRDERKPRPPPAQHLESSEPGIGLDTTSDRHQTLLEPPENTSDVPEAQVDNKRLADANNALSAAVSKQDVAKAAQREHAPEDRSGYYAALKQIATSFGGNGGYYDTKIKQEEAQQGNYKAQLAAHLKNQYRTDALDEKKREFAIKEKDAETNRGLLEEQRKTGNELRARGQDILAGNQTNKQVLDFNKELPEEDTVSSLNRIMGRVDDPSPIQGFEEGKNAGKFLRVVPYGIGDKLADTAGNMARHGTEAEGLMQDAETVMLGIVNKTSGKAFTERELDLAMARLGQAAGQSEDAFRRAYKQTMGNVQNRINRYYQAQSPSAQGEIDRRGIIPKIQPQAPGYAPKGAGPVNRPTGGIDVSFPGGSPPPIDTSIPVKEPQQQRYEQLSPEELQGAQQLGKGAAGFIRNHHLNDTASDVYDWVKAKFGTKIDAVENAKKMQSDKESRERARKKAGLN